MVNDEMRTKRRVKLFRMLFHGEKKVAVVGIDCLPVLTLCSNCKSDYLQATPPLQLQSSNESRAHDLLSRFIMWSGYPVS